jgi:hypothetical protein
MPSFTAPALRPGANAPPGQADRHDLAVPNNCPPAHYADRTRDGARSVQRDTRAPVRAVRQDIPCHLPPELLPRFQVETVMETGVYP